MKGLLLNTTVWTAMVMVGFFPAYWQLRQFRRELRETIAEIRADREMRRERLLDGAPTWVHVRELDSSGRAWQGRFRFTEEQRPNGHS